MSILKFPPGLRDFALWYKDKKEANPLSPWVTALRLFSVALHKCPCAHLSFCSVQVSTSSTPTILKSGLFVSLDTVAHIYVSASMYIGLYVSFVCCWLTFHFIYVL